MSRRSFHRMPGWARRCLARRTNWALWLCKRAVLAIGLRFAGFVMSWLLGATLLSASGPALAQDQAPDRIYRCRGPAGATVYQNASGKHCQELPLSVPVPMPKLPAASTGRTHGQQARAQQSGGQQSGGQQAVAPIPRGSPRIEVTTQRRRDDDRQRLLTEELGRERLRLDALQQQLNEAEPIQRGGARHEQSDRDRLEGLRQDIARIEASISSIERELRAAPRH